MIDFHSGSPQAALEGFTVHLLQKTICFSVLAALVLLGAPSVAVAEGNGSLLLATTTSVRDSGLLDTLLPRFTEDSGIAVKVVAVGTGAALRMGRSGDADVLLTHAPSAEQVLVDDGFVRKRTPFMQNYFVIAGPAEDPARIAQAESAVAAFQRIAREKSGWVSRGDDSGTHKREKSLWIKAGLDPEATWSGRRVTGSGMGLSLQVAGEKRAYILSDIGTFLAFQKRIDLVSLSGASETLRNVYSILQLDTDRFDHALESDNAEKLEAFLRSRPAQQLISEFGKERFGRTLFEPLLLE